MMNIPRRGFIPGEAILISAQINNFSNKAISYVKTELVQVMKTTLKTELKIGFRCFIICILLFIVKIPPTLCI